MDHCTLACEYHQKGFNCAQSVLLAFSDLTKLPRQQAMALSGGFGTGAGTRELCGAITGAVMTLGLLFPAEEGDPVAGKRRAAALAREFQARFSWRFGHLRCADLLPKSFTPDGTTPAAARLGLTNHCAILVVTAAEIVEELLAERGEAAKAP